VKFRRKAADNLDEEVDDSVDPASDLPFDAADDAPAGASDDGSQGPGAGPFDAEELDDTEGRVDLGALVLLPVPGTELQLQVDEASGNVSSVMFAGSDGALELRVFAAPRHGDLWSEVRPQIAADMAQRGGTASEREGRFGTELLCQATIKRPDGTTATQPSRIIGINGRRWLLRATLLGKPAVEPDATAEWEETISQVAVRRGAHAMPVGEALPVVMPANARRVEPPTS
jgi:uncharacterized protein DUF3710